MKNHFCGRVGWVLVMLALAALVGCSDNNPVSTNAQLSALSAVSPPDSHVQFTANIATIDADSRILTFDGDFYPVLVPDTCVIVSVILGVQTPITFEDLVIGDLARVCGVLQNDGYLRANRIVVYGDGECDGFDAVFTDSIASINYEAGSLTVFGVAETIVIDEATVIWGMLPHQRYLRPAEAGDNLLIARDGSYGFGDHVFQYDTVYAFEDLQVGQIVAIKANRIDENTLIAVEIKVLNCNFWNSVQFIDMLATIDYDNRLVTFAGESWIGTICANAMLQDAEGEPITLEDFSVDNLVAVKGVELVADTLRIAQMSLE